MRSEPGPGADYDFNHLVPVDWLLTVISTTRCLERQQQSSSGCQGLKGRREGDTQDSTM